MAFEGNKTRHFSSLCFSFYTSGNHRRIKGCLIGFFVKDLRSSQQYRKTELGLEEISCLSPFQLLNSPHGCPIRCSQLYSKCVPLQLRPTGPQAPSWELWDTLQSWQVATAVIGIILKVTYETPSALQMQQYEQLKFYTHSPYWRSPPLFTAINSPATKNELLEMGHQRPFLWLGEIGSCGNRSGCICAVCSMHACRINCVGLLESNSVEGPLFICYWWVSVPSDQKWSANFMWHRLGKSRARIKWDAEAQPRDAAHTLCRTQEARLAVILPES